MGQRLFNAEVFYRLFPDTTSRDFFHYIKPILQDSQSDFDISVIHMGVNNILNVGSTAEAVSNSILLIGNQGKNYGVKELSQISGYRIIDHNNIISENFGNMACT